MSRLKHQYTISKKTKYALQMYSHVSQVKVWRHHFVIDLSIYMTMIIQTLNLAALSEEDNFKKCIHWQT